MGTLQLIVDHYAHEQGYDHSAPEQVYDHSAHEQGYYHSAPVPFTHHTYTQPTLHAHSPLSMHTAHLACTRSGGSHSCMHTKRRLTLLLFRAPLLHASHELMLACTPDIHMDPLTAHSLTEGPPPPACTRIPTHTLPPTPPLCIQLHLLAESSADPFKRDRWGHTPLDEATKVGSTDAITYLTHLQVGGGGGE